MADRGWRTAAFYRFLDCPLFGHPKIPGGMNLVQALRLHSVPRVALVGAGGKTTALFRLAREYRHALVTTTTHLAVEQSARADHHRTIHEKEAFDANLPPGVVLLTGRVDESRFAGVDFLTLERILPLTDSCRLPLLIEADGARQLPLKAPAEHEPAIPPFVDTVIVVAGLSGLEKPLSEEWVHRPERFAAFSGLTMGETITPEALARVLLHPSGGLKNIPPSARPIVLLNQADTPQLQAQGQVLAHELLSGYRAVVIAALNPPAIRSSVANPLAHGLFAVHEPIAGIILAAGGSQRLGQPKQLLDWRGTPFVRRVAETALQAGLSAVVVVAGAYEEEIRAAVRDLPIILAHNPAWESGQSSSIRVGLKALPPETGATLFLLADQPQTPLSLIRALVERHAETLAPTVAPRVGGQRANPVLFDRATFADLLALSGDIGGRALFSRYRIEWVEWHDESLLLDVDTVEDYHRLQAL